MHPVNALFTNLIVSFSPISAAEEQIALIISARRWLVLLLLLVALGGTAGCATSFFYERADRLANRWVGGYVDLDASQQASLDAGLAELHAWHRREQLPAYADWLLGLAARLDEDRPFAADELRARSGELAQYWRVLAESSLPLMTGLGAGLADAQVAELLAALRESHESEFEALERRSTSWQQQRQARSMTRFLRRFAGRLTSRQQAAISAWAEGLEPLRAATFENRAGWIDELAVALSRRDDPVALHEAGQLLFVTPSKRWTSGYAALVERNSAHTMNFMAEFLNGLEDPQRARAIDRLERLAAEFEQLARSGR
jgi:hypothetical protein